MPSMDDCNLKRKPSGCNGKELALFMCYQMGFCFISSYEPLLWLLLLFLRVNFKRILRVLRLESNGAFLRMFPPL